jgi:hypothetical protein
MGGREDWGRSEEDLMRSRGAVDEVLVSLGLAPAHFDENLRARVGVLMALSCFSQLNASACKLALSANLLICMCCSLGCHYAAVQWPARPAGC